MLRKFKTLLMGAALSITLIGAANASWLTFQGQEQVADILADGWTQCSDGQDYDLVQSSFDADERAKVAKLKDKEFGVALIPERHVFSRETECDYTLKFSYRDSKDNTKTKMLSINVVLQRQPHPMGKNLNMDEIVLKVNEMLPGIVTKVLTFIVPQIEKVAPELIDSIVGKLDTTTTDPVSGEVSSPSAVSSFITMVLNQFKPLIPMLTSALNSFGPEIAHKIFAALAGALGVDLPAALPASGPAVDPAVDPVIVPAVDLVVANPDDKPKKPKDGDKKPKKPKKDKE